MKTPYQHRHFDDPNRKLAFSPVEFDPQAAHQKSLTRAQIHQFNTDGYLSPLSVFETSQADELRRYFDDLIEQVVGANDKRNGYSINGYHLSCQRLYDIIHTPEIVAAVKALLGPDIVCWSTHMFCKLPGDPMEVPLHQDAVYWPFNAAKTLTVWLAIDDADDDNGTMHFVPGSHLLGPLPFDELELDGTRVLGRRVANRERYNDSFVNELKAGQFSVHSDLLLHGSQPNLSTRRRAGLTLRYASADATMAEGWEDWRAGSVHVAGNVSDYWPNRPRPEGEDPHLMRDKRGTFDGVPA
ncbi:phytanoyl-CoA dioxygenase family protein [Alteromonas oceanisediminis]|uniref:phytanoyl-CoA dioxygenase family protein n=1 Tax=Alteromonas oceanisediminis TaxID=2836180 RepID=UPI001BDB20CD|nr:phytanoyl-CoA dioxygenase family protein [Alteromonas oceanisediminis]MBT0586263.1 phytanoyl-CoA dioxygenase family protein [Alteromonas oceanisediminis]